MTPRQHLDEDQCLDAAREIAGDPPPKWLVSALRNLTSEVFKFDQGKMQELTRSELRKRLESIVSAAELLQQELLDLDPSIRNSDTTLHVMQAMLSDTAGFYAVTNHGHHVVAAIAKSARTELERLPSGAGRGRAQPERQGIATRTLIAAIVLEAWRETRGGLPGRDNDDACRAADSLAGASKVERLDIGWRNAMEEAMSLPEHSGWRNWIASGFRYAHTAGS